MVITYDILLAILGVTGTIAGTWLTIQKISAHYKKQKNEYSAFIISEALKEINSKEAQLESKIEAVDMRIENLERSVEKDLLHLKEAYQGEIKSLTSKIDDLREQVTTQHTNVVSLLAKLIENQKD